MKKGTFVKVVDGEVGVEKAVPEHVAADEGKEQQPGFHLVHLIRCSVYSRLLIGLDRHGERRCDVCFIYKSVSMLKRLN
jgi:hypothetical protein